MIGRTFEENLVEVLRDVITGAPEDSRLVIDLIVDRVVLLRDQPLEELLGHYDKTYTSGPLSGPKGFIERRMSKRIVQATIRWIAEVEKAIKEARA